MQACWAENVMRVLWYINLLKHQLHLLTHGFIFIKRSYIELKRRNGLMLAIFSLLCCPIPTQKSKGFIRSTQKGHIQDALTFVLDECSCGRCYRWCLKDQWEWSPRAPHSCMHSLQWVKSTLHVHGCLMLTWNKQNVTNKVSCLFRILLCKWLGYNMSIIY